MRYSLTTIAVETDEETGATMIVAVDQPECTMLVAYNVESLEGLLVVYDTMPSASMDPDESDDDEDTNSRPPPPPTAFITRDEALQAFERMEGREPAPGELP
jgi:hypothetical protein